MAAEPVEFWSIGNSLDLYNVPQWGHRYFSINDSGHLSVHPNKDPNNGLDLKELVERVQQRGLDLPLLIRFNGILEDRLGEIHAAFGQAARDHSYRGSYCCVYPIKVNQQRQVVEEIVKHGKPYGFGLEAGSKPELLAVVALADNDTPIICNGFKDDEYIEMALLAQRLGRRIIPVVEKFTELDLILKYAAKVGVRPQIGMRVKLASRGSGRWQTSGGFRSKFGLTVSEIVRGLQVLREHDMADCLKLLHFHLGSQITNIRYVKSALIEATRVYVDLVQKGAGLEYLDVGGGLGVDYDGSESNYESSVNYRLQEYANDVIFHVQTVCDNVGVAHPNIISESGRAVSAYHSVLVFGVLGVSSHIVENNVPESLPGTAPQPLRDLHYTYNHVNLRNLLESYHDTQQALDMAMNSFSSGHLTLDQRCLAERMFWAIARKLQTLIKQLDFVPEELEGIDRLLAETYFCNFSLFQSMPDSWAIKQLFPVMPIHRLDKRPTRHAIIGDITCDSDGKIDQFIDRRDVKRTLLLHEFDGSPYYLGAFLVGAYQEILGDLHNLFGDTNMVHIDLDSKGNVIVSTTIEGNTVRDVLQYVQFQGQHLIESLQGDTDRAVNEGRLPAEQARQLMEFYQAGLEGYTYLEAPTDE